MHKKTFLWAGFTAVALTILIYFLPPVRVRVDSRIQPVVTELRYWLNPPEEVVFVPQAAVLPTRLPLAQIEPTPTLDPTLVATFTPIPTLATESGVTTPAAPLPTAAPPTLTPSPTPVSLPPSALIEGLTFQTQRGAWNYCGPTNVAMAVSFWGEPRTREEVGQVVRGSLTRVDDKNVSPAEMVHYVRTETTLNALMRSGGELSVLKRLVAAGSAIAPQ